jgi:23S rRNA (guanosine2251-2'-O)-methyltransferase
MAADPRLTRRIVRSAVDYTKLATRRRGRGGHLGRIRRDVRRRLSTGFHAVARLRQHPESVRAIYVVAARQDRRARELIERAEGAGVAVHPVDDKRLDAIAGSDRHQGVVAEVDAALPHRTLDDVLEGLDEPPLLLVLDGVTDPHNLGACLRSADAFGAHAVIVPKDRAVGLNATVAKAASGAADTVL